MHRCYCGGNFGAGSAMRSSVVQSQSQPQRPRGDLMSVASSSRQSTRPTQFVRRPSLKSNGPGLGLGHSSTGLSNEFSRRNSTAASVSHCSSCSCSSSQQRQQSRAKVLRWGWERTGGVNSNTNTTTSSSGNSNSSSPQYTDNRRFYEQSACVASRQPSQGQGQVQVQSGNSTASSSSASPHQPTSMLHYSHNNELQQLQALQKFRLMNASQCFSDVRRDELRLQQAYEKLERSNANTDKWHKDRDNEANRQQQLNSTTTTTTPYALRQKMLQLRLQADEKQGRGTGATCAPLGRSCALRYN
ncbi:putative protein TPRXL [Drosophila obscura]|uniref:putative protein TPRXL n=1 Tax=Drosophila obscura TaxID=7282 RepID=UPI001BB13350|nr:putative protein TPRXL [Drosophila obscura]